MTDTRNAPESAAVATKNLPTLIPFPLSEYLTK